MVRLPPRTLLIGAVAALLRFNCYSQIIAALANLLLGLPVVNYFDAPFGPQYRPMGSMFSRIPQHTGQLGEGRQNRHRGKIILPWA